MDEAETRPTRRSRLAQASVQTQTSRAKGCAKRPVHGELGKHPQRSETIRDLPVRIDGRLYGRGKV